MAYTPYYAPYQRPMYYNPSIPQEMANMQNQQPIQQPQMQQTIQHMPMQTPIQQMPTNDMLWVLGQTEAESYLVAPNNSVTLWDKNKDTVYIKSVNGQGVPSMRILDYKERTAESEKSPDKHACQCGGKFVSKEDFNALQGEFEALKDELNELKTKPKTKTVKKSVEEAEYGE